MIYIKVFYLLIKKCFWIGLKLLPSKIDPQGVGKDKVLRTGIPILNVGGAKTTITGINIPKDGVTPPFKKIKISIVMDPGLIPVTTALIGVELGSVLIETICVEVVGTVHKTFVMFAGLQFCNNPILIQIFWQVFKLSVLEPDVGNDIF